MPQSEPCYADVARGGCRHPEPTEESVSSNVPSISESSTPTSGLLYRAWRVELDPTPKQRAMLGRHAGVARYAFNFGLRRCQEERDAGRKRPTAMTLQKEIVALKHASEDAGGLPWLAESSKGAPESGLRDLERAWSGFFAKRTSYPKPRRRRDGGHFGLPGARADGTAIVLPRIGRVRVQPGERGYIPTGNYSTVRLTEKAGRWFASVGAAVVEPAAPNGGPVVAVDLGVRKLGTRADGTVIVNPRAEAQEAKRLRRSVLSVRRKHRAAMKRQGTPKKGERRVPSRRLIRARQRLSRVKMRVANIRRDALHKATTALANSAGVIVLEDLRVGNMTRSRKGMGRAAKAGLNRAILDVGWYEFRRMLAYKTTWYGSCLVVAPPQFTSQDCSACGARTNVGACETYTCSGCGIVLDRDVNAARNLLHRYAAGCVNPDVAVGYTGPGLDPNARGAAVRPRRIRSARQAATIRERIGSN